MTFWNKITEGFVKAMGHVMAAQSRQEERRKQRPKFTYTDYGVAVHGKKYLNTSQRADLTALLEKIAVEEDKFVREELMKQLRSMPVKFVKVRRQETVEYGRYVGPHLCEIRAAGGGAKEKARAENRRLAMSNDTFPAALAA